MSARSPYRWVAPLWIAMLLGRGAVASAAEPGTAPATQPEPAESAEFLFGYADSGGIPIHFVSRGSGPLVLLIHGFPDYWYGWRDQLAALAPAYQAVAIDQRGYNTSGQPAGVENYTMDKLVGDVAAVLRHLQRDRATIVGHDWGGAVAWAFAMQRPENTERLVILNCPHPRGLLHELKHNEQQRQNSEYARTFQQPDAVSKVPAGLLPLWVKEPEARERYRAAFQRSSLDGMLNYYKANYPREPYDVPDYPQVKCPTLVVHGAQDRSRERDS